MGLAGLLGHLWSLKQKEIMNPGRFHEFESGKLIQWRSQLRRPSQSWEVKGSDLAQPKGILVPPKLEGFSSDYPKRKKKATLFQGRDKYGTSGFPAPSPQTPLRRITEQTTAGHSTDGESNRRHWREKTLHTKGLKTSPCTSPYPTQFIAVPIHRLLKCCCDKILTLVFFFLFVLSMCLKKGTTGIWVGWFILFGPILPTVGCLVSLDSTY